MAPIQTTIPRSYEAKAQKLIRQAMWRRGTTYRQLAARLSARGLPFTRDNLANKISRGRFSAGFLVLCLEILEDEHEGTGVGNAREQLASTVPVAEQRPRL